MVITHHNVHRKTIADMPSDMTMERPYSRIIGHEIYHHIAWLPWTGIPPVDELRVPSLRVLGARNDSIPLSHPLSDDPDGMTVEVHWVRDGDVTAHDEADRGAITKVVDVPLGVVGVGGVALICEEEYRVA